MRPPPPPLVCTQVCNRPINGYNFMGTGMGCYKWDGTCSPDFAYGEKGAGNLIPPNSELQFAVEILDV